MEPQSKVIVFGMGGTIAGTGSAGKSINYQPGQLDVDDLLQNIPPDMRLHTTVVGQQICNVNSDDVTSQQWIDLACRINARASDPEVDGFVVTHGTDTLEETAYFLNLTVKTKKPVVITGAMRPATALSADGPLNLMQAIRLATNRQAYGLGVLVCFAGHVFGARDVEKATTFGVEGFTGRNSGCLGSVIEDDFQLYQHPVRAHTTDTEFDVRDSTSLPAVDIAYFSSESDAGVLDYFTSSGVRGLVVAGAGAGCYSQEWNKRIEQISQKICVVRCSRVGNGPAIADDSYRGNLVLGGDLSPQKAAVLLRLALSVTDEPHLIQKMFERY